MMYDSLPQAQAQAPNALPTTSQKSRMNNQPIRRISRNDSCLCGSGKKYKHCCLIKQPTPVNNLKPNGFDVAAAIQAALHHHRAGDLNKAAAIYSQVLQADSGQAEALHLLGLIHHQQGNNITAVGLIRQALARNASDPLIYNNLGVAQFALGSVDEAIANYQHALALQPGYIDAHNNLGAALKLQGKLEESEKCFQQVLTLNPNLPQGYSNLGSVQQAQGKLNEAITSYHKAIALKPDFAEAHANLASALQAQGQLEAAVESCLNALRCGPNYSRGYCNLGVALQAQGKLEQAIPNYRKAIALAPNEFETHNNLGSALQGVGQLQEAIDCYQKALEIKPDYTEAFCNLGAAFQAQGKQVEAIACFQSALLHTPNHPDACFNLATALQTQGRLEEASHYYHQASAAGFGAVARILCDLMLAPIMGPWEEVRASRAKFESNLDRLLAESVSIEDPVKDGCLTNFYAANHGFNDKDIQQKIAHFYEKASPSLLYSARHCDQPRSTGKSIRIGFYSKHIYMHSVSICFNKVVEHLSQQDGFEVMLISNHDASHAAVSRLYSNFKGEHVQVPYQLEAARNKIALLELDIFVYLDIGMEPLSYFLAFSRLAPIQCVLPGHPVTTGIKNVDYYLSYDLAESPDAQDHYSEKLLRLPIGAFYFERPTLPLTFKTKQDFGLPNNRRIYLCPMKLQKIHPDFDEAMTRILELDPEGLIVLFEDHQHTAWKELLEQRFNKTVPTTVRDRIWFLPWINDREDFLSINQLSDVVLDPFHFGIGSTAISVFSVGTPIVTKPSQYLRGRIGLFYSKLLDTMECVENSTEDYARKAVAIATDGVLRQKIKSKLLSNSGNVFENQQALSDVSALFRTLSAPAEGTIA